MGLLKQLNGEDDRSIENILSSTTEMYGYRSGLSNLRLILRLRHVQELSEDELDEFIDFCAEKALVNINGGDGL